MTATNFLLRTELTVHEPTVRGPLAVFPISGPDLTVVFKAYGEGGAQVRELPHGASVNQLLVTNPLDVPVLLYEGEEVSGAQQDRTLDVSVLVAAGTQCVVPVTCVEAGRWDGSRHGEAFSPAPQTSYPELRRLKNRASRATGVAAAAQGAVWQEVAAKSARHGARGDSGAMRDVFEARRERIDELASIERREDQRGSVCCVGGRIAVLDFIGQPNAYAAMHAPLMAGYALDAVEHVTATPPSVDQVQTFVNAAVRAPHLRRPSVGMGDDARFETPQAEGSALLVGSELIAMTAFAAEARNTRVQRPSRRRPR